MIRMKKGAAEGNADVVALVEHSKHEDGSTDGREVAKTAFAIAFAWMDGADEWNGWKFIREEVKW